MIDVYEEFGGMRLSREKRCTQRKPAPVPLCPQQIPHDCINNTNTDKRTQISMLRVGFEPTILVFKMAGPCGDCIGKKTVDLVKKFILIYMRSMFSNGLFINS
jgi:hypothetical protein